MTGAPSSWIALVEKANFRGAEVLENDAILVSGETNVEP